ncbi:MULTISPECIES: DciA family protein [unclassified Lysobacter]
MSDSRSNPPRRPSTPVAALDALLAEPAGDPIRRALWLDELDRRLRPLLPPPLAAHARLANYERGRLVYLVDSPVWRTKLRLLAPELLAGARSIGLGVTEFAIKTSLVSSAPPQPAPRKPVTMSAAAHQALQAALASLKPSNPDEPDDAG